MATNGHSNGATSNGSAPPSITLYTNHGCPWAHRAHIALAALDLPFTEHIIDLSVPRTPEYLRINHRGLVPTLVYNGNTIPESGIVAHFLADAHPEGGLVKTSTEPGGALQRARIALLVDSVVGKVNPFLFQGIRAVTAEEREEAGVGFVAAVKKEVEPLLADVDPFFGGSKKLTLAEVQTASFLLRYLSFSRHGLLAPNLLQDLETQTPQFYKWATRVVKEEAVLGIWNEEEVVRRTKARIEKAAKAAKEGGK